MTIKRKLSLGLGFLFAIIFALAIFCSFYIQKLSKEADDILKDNYNSLVYSRNMLSALDDIRNAMTNGVFNQSGGKGLSDYFLNVFETGRIEFEKNLNAESRNITEINETEVVNRLNKGYALFQSLCEKIKKGSGDPAMYYREFLPAYEKVHQSVNAIYDINMQAVVRKSQFTQRDSEKIISYMGLIGVIFTLLALGYFWYFPFYISNTISVLSDKMKALLKENDLQLDIKTNDETYVLLHAINLLENKLGKK
jgi:two-component system, NtrC family, sensor histidine kinase KinB